jgi:hypothetical protein
MERNVRCKMANVTWINYVDIPSYLLDFPLFLWNYNLPASYY